MERENVVSLDSHPCINPTWPKIPKSKLHGNVVSTNDTKPETLVILEKDLPNTGS